MTLNGLDETLFHQAALPFGAVATSDHRAFDRYWFSALAPDGSAALFMGSGRYPNMGTRDGFVNLLAGVRQHNVRVAAPDAAGPDPAVAGIGPLRVEVVEPFHRIRVLLGEHPGPLRAALEFRATNPPFLEQPHREVERNRVLQDQLRYDQVGSWTGWVSLAGERIEVEDWWGDRDHSWGVRVDVGGLEPPQLSRRTRSLTIWCSWSTRGSWGVVQQRSYADGRAGYLDGAVFDSGGRRRRVTGLQHQVSYAERTRIWTAATLRLTLSDGDTLTLDARPHTERPWASRGGGYNRGFADGLGFGALRGELVEHDEYLLPDAEAVLLDGTPLDPGHREQLARVTVNGEPGWAHLPIMPRSGDMAHQGS